MGKQVYASMTRPFVAERDKAYDALALLVARGGVLRSSENWLFEALRPYIESGHVLVTDHWLTICDDFEGLLLDLAAQNDRFATILVAYRALMRDKLDSYASVDNFVAVRLSETPSIIGKLDVMCQILSDVSSKLDSISERVATLEDKLHEVDLAVSVVELQLDEDVDS